MKWYDWPLLIVISVPLAFILWWLYCFMVYVYDGSTCPDWIAVNEFMKAVLIKIGEVFRGFEK